MATVEKIPGLREKQKAATRNEITRTGVGLFVTQGFANTTIEQIVAPLGIAKRTFFRYFETKDDVVFAWYEEKTAELVIELLNRPEHEKPFRAICETLASLLQRYDANPDWTWKLVCLAKETPSLLGRGYEKQIVRQKALADALIERDRTDEITPLEARILVGTAMIAFTAAIDEWYLGGGKTNLRPIMESAFALAGNQ